MKNHRLSRWVSILFQSVSDARISTRSWPQHGQADLNGPAAGSTNTGQEQVKICFEAYGAKTGQLFLIRSDGMGESSMGYKQIVFDVDGTLIDTEYAVIHSLQDTMRAITGKIIPDKELTFALGITGENALQRLEVNDITAALSMWDRNMKKYQDTITVFHGIKELLETIAKLKLGIGIVTSKTREEFRCDFQIFDISSYFGTVVCADDTLQHKPEPEPLLKYMEWTKCQANELLYIGDSIYDMQCARHANANFGLAKWGAGNRVDAPNSFCTPFDLAESLTLLEN